MTALLAAAVAAIPFGALAAAYQAAPTSVRRRGVAPIVVAVIAPALWSTFLPLHPTGLALWDAALAVTWTVVLGVLAAGVERRVLLGACAATAVAAVAGGAGLLPAALALGLAAGSTALAVRLPGPKALAGALLGIALLQLDWPVPTAPRLALAVVTLVVLTGAAAVRASRPVRRGVGLAAGTVVALTGVAGVAFALAALQVRDDLGAAVDLAGAGLRAAETGDTVAAADALTKARDRFEAASRRADSWLAQPVRLVPGAAANHRALRAITAAGTELATQAARVAVDGDAADVRLRDGGVDLARARRLSTALTELAGQLHVADRALRDATSTWLATPLDDALDRMHAEVGDAAAATTASARVARVVPALLGADGDRRWFVGVLGNSEARATGGIIGSSGVLTASAGRLDLGPMRRTAELNTSAPRALEGLAEYVERYGRYQPDRTWQNVTMSPDGPTVARAVEQLYPQSGGGEVDGVVLVDPFALAALVRLVGPVHVASWPTDITAADIPRVLLHEQYLDFERPERLDFLGEVADAVFDRLSDGELPPPARIAQLLGPVVRDGHLVLHSTDDAEQAVFAAMGATAAMPPVDGDALAVITQNASGNKIDWFLRRTVDYDVTVQPTGETSAELTITLTNTAPAVGLPDYVIAGSGPDPTARGENRTILSVYSPLDLVDSSLPLEGERELGRNVYSTFVTIPPGGSTTVHLTLAGTIEGPYRLVVRRQATVVPDELTVRVA